MSRRFESFLKSQIALLTEDGLLRELKTISGPQGPWAELDGKRTLILCSNDYLGLASDPRISEAVKEAVKKYGTGAGASRLISGHMIPHQDLETAVAEFKGCESALLFNSGYHANLGVIPALFGPGDLILSDELNHASLIDGCRLSRADVRIYPHRDCAALKEILSGCREYDKKLILTDGVFSMDGDIAPLPQIVKMAREHDACLMVDDAHATGVLGPNGRGTAEHFGLTPEDIDIQMGTLGKGLGCFGAFVTGKKELRDLLVNKARSFIFTTALPPALAAASSKALEIAGEESSLRERLWDNVRFFREGLKNLGLDVMGSETPIIPIFMGEAERAMEISRRLLKEGVFIQGIRPPTVPMGQSRLRATLSSAHTIEDIKFALSVLTRVGL